jgi:hypothetical protein
MTAVFVEEGPDQGAIWHFGEPFKEEIIKKVNELKARDAKLLTSFVSLLIVLMNFRSRN